MSKEIIKKSRNIDLGIMVGITTITVINTFVQKGIGLNVLVICLCLLSMYRLWKEK